MKVIYFLTRHGFRDLFKALVTSYVIKKHNNFVVNIRPERQRAHLLKYEYTKFSFPYPTFSPFLKSCNIFIKSCLLPLRNLN